MRRVLAILFLSVYLISTTEFGQLLKFPMLVEHYFEHKEKNSQITVIEFLALHYEGITSKTIRTMAITSMTSNYRFWFIPMF